MERVAKVLAEVSEATAVIRGSSLESEFRAGDRVFLRASNREVFGQWNVCRPKGSSVTLRWVDETPQGAAFFDGNRAPAGLIDGAEFYGYVVSLQRNFSE
jgi:hypothetical protein